MIDAHVSFDGAYSYERLLEYVKAAVEKGIEELVILEPTHKFEECRLLYREVCATYPCQKAWYDSIEKISIRTYQGFICEMKEKSFPITVRFGLCVCYFTQHEYFISQLLRSFPYDVKTGVIQFVDNIAFSWKGYSEEMMWKKYNADFLYRRYYEMMNAMLTSRLFDGVSGFDHMKLLGSEPKFRLTHTYQKMAMLLMEHQMYVEDDSSVIYRYHHHDRGLNEAFRALCRRYHVEIKPASRATCPAEVGRCFSELPMEEEGR